MIYLDIISLFCFTVHLCSATEEVVIQIDKKNEDLAYVIREIETQGNLIHKRHMFENFHYFEKREPLNENEFEKRSVGEESAKTDYVIKRHDQYELKMEKRYNLDNNMLNSIYGIQSKNSACERKPECGNDSQEYLDFNDVLYKCQWNIHNDGQNGGFCGNDLGLRDVYLKGLSGKGVVSTVLDDGIEHKHDDLKDNYDPYASYDYNDEDNDPTPHLETPGNNHGTLCCGTIAASGNNTKCGIGIAFNSKIGGIRILDGRLTNRIIAESVFYNNSHIDIYSASWGPTDDGKHFGGPDEVVNKAMIQGIKEGRGGKGSIYVWATGNGGNRNDTCSCDGYVGSIYTNSIGSITEDGSKSYFSEVCPSTMAVVYTGSHATGSSTKSTIGVVATDVNNGCTKKFQGTSSAAPLAAGVIALVLEANPALTWRCIQYIILSTSKVTNIEDNFWITNGAGLLFNKRLGAGVLDAKSMVAMAQQNWKIVPEQQKINLTVRPNLAIPSPKSSETIACKNISLYFNGSTGKPNEFFVHVEHVELYLNISIKNRGRLSIDLISPMNTSSRMLEFRISDVASNIDFTFMTIRNWCENPQGNWVVMLCDHGTHNQVNLEELMLTFYGVNQNVSTCQRNIETPSSKWDGQNLKRIKTSQDERSSHAYVKRADN